MAIYHCSIKIISRGKGKSAVAAAAYRAGEKITNEYDGITHDYTRKGGVVHTEILLPNHAPAEYSDRATLWNAVEKIEKAKNSQLAREIELALPVELTREQNISLAREYVRQLFVSAGMCADVCVHDTGGGNPHAHVLLTMRPFNEDGTWGDKQKKEYILDKNGNKIYDPKKRQYKCKSIPTTDWNEQTKAEQWRSGWAAAVNTVLEKNHLFERVDHRSYKRQGIELIPTVHLGVAATQMERKGIATERGNMNREIAHNNKILLSILIKLKQLKDWLKEAISPKAPPTFADVVRGIIDGSERHTRCNPKTAKRLFDFMQENNISTLSEVRKTVSQIQHSSNNTREDSRAYEQWQNLLSIRFTAEEITREIARRTNQPQHQRKPRTREMER